MAYRIAPSPIMLSVFNVIHLLQAFPNMTRHTLCSSWQDFSSVLCFVYAFYIFVMLHLQNLNFDSTRSDTSAPAELL